MQVPGAYILVVLIWSTTPLAIHWSNSSLSFVAAISARMVIAAVCCFALLKILRQPLVTHRRDWLVYIASALGLFPNMLLVYWAAQSIPSGLMSVIMGIYPFFVGIFSVLILKENPFSPRRVLALLLAMLGLWVVHRDQLSTGVDAFWGISAMVLACVIWAFSSVMVKKLGAAIGPLQMGTGSLIVSAPFFLVCWIWLDGEIPLAIDRTSLIGVIYLVLAGSMLGHTLWFFVLRACSVTSVSLITLITPVMALTWGALAGEKFSPLALLGAALIVTALALYQGVLARVAKSLARLRWRRPVVVVAPEFTDSGSGHRRRLE